MSPKKVKSIPIFHTAIMIVLLFMPVLNIYGNPDGWSYATLFSFPLSVLFFCYSILKGTNILDVMSKGLPIYFLYWGLAMAIFTFNLPLGVVQIFITYLMFFGCFHVNPYIRYFKVFALICLAVFFIQEVTYQTSGYRISGIIDGLPLHSIEDTSLYLSIKTEGERSSSIFSEPAHFAQFLLPLLAIEIFYDKSKFHWIYAVIVGIALLYLRSGNGLLGLIPILLFVIPFFSKGKKPSKWLILILFSFIIMEIGYLYVNSQIGIDMAKRQEELATIYEDGSRSGFLRVWRGIYVFQDYNIFEKIFGCPSSAIQLTHIKNAGMEMEAGYELYFNMLQKIFLNTGFIGFLIFVYICFHIWRNNTICGRAILSTMIVLSFISAIYMTSTMLTYMLLAENMKNSKWDNQYYNE